MTTRCTRCQNQATALMRFEYAHARIWIDDLDGPTDVSAYPFCDRHAATMTAPVGWSLDDRRSPMQSLFSMDVA
jgi:hypothetical protein